MHTPPEPCIHEATEEVARRQPTKIAIRFRGCELTYPQLDERSNQVARSLRKAGVTIDTPVALVCNRSAEMIVCLLGILKAGGAYAGFNPTEPAARLQSMLTDCVNPIVLTESSLRPQVESLSSRVIAIDDLRFCAGESIAPLTPLGEQGNRQLAYISFTSGSTGTPKGVCVEHRSVMRLVVNPNFVTITSDDVFLQFAPLAFDATTFEIWGCLVNGACLVVHPPETPSIEDLGETIQRERISLLWLTAGLFHQMVDHKLEALSGVRQLLSGGDVLSTAHVRKALQVPGERWVINGYGPTECTTFTTCHRMTKSEPLGLTVPIGRAVASANVYVVDESMNPVPSGEAGELLVGGDALSRGYLNRPDLTREKFIADPFSRIPGARLYRTGDRVRCRPDGVMEFLGRVDRMIKLRGFRIELGEIEAALRGLSGVREAVVRAQHDSAGPLIIAAFVVPQHSTNAASLREDLADLLPAYMLPGRIHLLEKFPLTANGKVDDSKLPASEPIPQGSSAPLEAPKTELEKTISHIWEDVLQVRPIGVDMNFFTDLNGHSLQGTQLLARMSEKFNVRLPLNILFEAPSIAAFAKLLENKNKYAAGGRR